MKNLKSVFALLVLLGSTGIASANEFYTYNQGPRVAASVSFPGFRFVVGRPGYYCWYQGRYYNRAAWDRFYRLHRDYGRFAYRYRGNDQRRFEENNNFYDDRDRKDDREQARNSDHHSDQDQHRDFHRD